MSGVEIENFRQIGIKIIYLIMMEYYQMLIGAIRTKKMVIYLFGQMIQIILMKNKDFMHIG